MGTSSWPLFDLEIRTPRLTLRYLDDDLAEELVAVAARGVHHPSTMPFTIPWTDAPSPQLEQEALRFYWRSRAETTPASWRLLHAVILDGTVIGAGDLFAVDFPALRQFETGSWLGLDHQGQGLGKELRMCTLTLGFDGLGAEWARTSAWADNGASLGVTRSLGYESEGPRRLLRRGVPDDILAYRMHREHWATIRREDITLHGVDAARGFLGLS